MKKICLALVFVFSLVALVGCGNKTSGTVSTDGSTSMEKVISALGEKFESDHSGVTFTYNPTGSSSGIAAVMEGRCDIGLSSRYLKDDEKAFLEPLSCCLRAIRRGGFEYPSCDEIRKNNSKFNALVVGLGSIGLLMLKGLKAFGVEMYGFKVWLFFGLYSCRFFLLDISFHCCFLIVLSV